MRQQANHASRSRDVPGGHYVASAGAAFTCIAMALAVGTAIAQPAQPFGALSGVGIWRSSGLNPGIPSRPVGAKLDDTVILIVRHAERESQAANSDLLEAEPGAGIGTARAQALAEIAAEHGVSAIYSTDFCRTAQTGQPTAALLGLTLELMPTGSSAAGVQTCQPAITVPTEPAPSGSLPEIAEHIKTARAGQATLVIGHSNTVPQLVEALSGSTLCPDPFPPDDRYGCLIPDDENHHLYIVRIAEAGTVTLESTIYGARPGN